jgi:hypothetical protein
MRKSAVLSLLNFIVPKPFESVAFFAKHPRKATVPRSHSQVLCLFSHSQHLCSGGHGFLTIGEQPATGLGEHLPLLVHPFQIDRHRFQNGASRKLVCESGWL